MYKKRSGSFRKTALFLLILLMSFAMLPFSAQAKKRSKRPKLSRTSVTLRKGKSVTLKVSRTSGKVRWRISSGKGVVSLKKISKKKYVVTAKKAGRAKITVKTGKRKVSCSVKVYAPEKRIPIYSGDANLDYLMKCMCEDAGVRPSMSDEEIAWKIYKWVAKHCVYDYEGILKYGKKALKKWPPYCLKPVYKLENKEEAIAAYKEKCDALQAKGKIIYSMKHMPAKGKYLYKKHKGHPGSTLFCYERLSGDCVYMASYFTGLCEYMGLRGGINIGKIYSSRKKKFTLHYISYIYLYGKKYYVDPGSAVHKVTRKNKFRSRYFKLSSKRRKKNYRLGKGKKDF